jgi:hypothetical protein
LEVLSVAAGGGLQNRPSQQGWGKAGDMKIELPLVVVIPRKRTIDKRFPLNLNGYRNAHFHLLDDVKKVYVDHVRESVGTMPVNATPPLSCTYTIYPRTAQSFDLGNSLCIVQKFAEDALVELGLIPEDNFKVINEVVYRYGCVDKTNPRVELEIVERRA